jgi:hypothetical protein
MSALFDLSCVIHVHSTHSDGTGSVEQVARAGERAGVDVVLLTDHDSLEAARAGEEGWYDGRTLLIAGHEISPPRRNHMLAFGLDHEVDWRGMSAARIASEVRERGGIGIAAHPFSEGSKRFPRLSSLGLAMSWDDLESADGLEVWSFVSDNGQNLPTIRAAVSFLTRPEHYVTHPPRRNLDEWDRLGARRRVVGVGGLDAHQFGVRIAGRALRVMGYARTFRQLRTHLLVTEQLNGELEHDRALVLDALREGRCYIAAHPVAPARGFRFWAESGSGELLEMGSEAPAGDWTLRVRTPAKAEVALLRDGAEVARGDDVTSLEHPASEPGVYRVEAYRETGGTRRTWVLSNPVYLRQRVRS